MNPPHKPTPFSTLMLAALGVVFGDIGTSPLYAFREALMHIGLGLTPDVVMGLLSMIVWSLVLVVTVQYVGFVLRADNRGEGGIFALTALAFSHLENPKWNPAILALGLMGGALFFGDAIITPAISVLSAVEGLEVATPVFQPYIIPIALAVIITLFSIQSFGTGSMGVMFGPIILVWFGVIGWLGLQQVMLHPDILHALNPMYALALAYHQPVHAFFVLGAVVLAITGVEALYADLGHFGRNAIRATWLGFVLPALVLNYFGQGALVLANPQAVGNPFYLLAPEDSRLALVALATAATVIASQAVISGAFALTSQAIQLGYLPRIAVKHTNRHQVGQVYLPVMNWLMLILVVLLVLIFHTSSNLAAAYGMTVIGTIVITTTLTSVVLVRRLGWPKWAGWVFFTIFVGINGTFLLANLHKLPHGGWFPLLFGALLFYLMHTWVRGREVASLHHKQFTPLLDEFLARLPKGVNRPERTAIFLASDLNHAPPALLYNLAHNNVIHAQVILLKVARARIPRYPEGERVRVQFLKHGFTTITTTYGFMEQPDVPGILARCADEYGLKVEYPQATSYFLSHHTYVPSAKPGLSRWQEPIFVFLEGVTASAISYFRIPNRQVIEIGAQVEI